MAIIAPFKGQMYSTNNVGEISEVVAPPYDVISEEEQESYYETHPHNVIRLILGKKKMGDSDWDNRYTRSADYLSRWESEDVLIRSESPSIYITALTYDPGDGNGTKTRWGLTALVLIEEEGAGVILPHERTFSAHKDDRLRLMRACNTQFSQIFSLYEDPGDKIMHSIRGSLESPRFSFVFRDGTTHKMWVIEDQSIIKEISGAFLDKQVLIADGHHRYESTCDFRNIMRTRYGVSRPKRRSFEFVMMYLSNMNDAGLSILPSHRLVKSVAGFQLKPFLQRCRSWFEIGTLSLPAGDGRQLSAKIKKWLEEEGQQTSPIAFRCNGDNQLYLLSLKPESRDDMGSDLHPSLKKLDVLVLSRLVLQKGLGFNLEELDNEEKFHYDSDMANTISMVDSGNYQMAFLLNPTSMKQVKEVVENSMIMPRKSTFFYPKILTGLVFNKIDPHEIIQTP